MNPGNISKQFLPLLRVVHFFRVDTAATLNINILTWDFYHTNLTYFNGKMPDYLELFNFWLFWETLTDLYRKPNVKNQLLLPTSAHPPHTTENSVYSLGLRIIRNVSDPDQREQRLQELAHRLRERQYKEAVIQAGIEKARKVKREDALRKVVKEPEMKPPHLIVQYDRRSCPALSSILRNNHQAMSSKDRRMEKIFQGHLGQFLKGVSTWRIFSPELSSHRLETQQEWGHRIEHMESPGAIRELGGQVAPCVLISQIDRQRW